MCRSIRPLNNFEPPVTEDEVRAAVVDGDVALLVLHAQRVLRVPVEGRRLALLEVLDHAVLGEGRVHVRRGARRRCCRQAGAPEQAEPRESEGDP
jgi:hypothetical protein